MNTDSSPVPPRPLLNIIQRLFVFSCRRTFWRPNCIYYFLLCHPNTDLANFPWSNVSRCRCSPPVQKMHVKFHSDRSLTGNSYFWKTRSKCFSAIPARGRAELIAGKSGDSTIPKGLCPSAQGCEERATLGWGQHGFQPQRGCATFPPARQNPVGVVRAFHHFPG